MASNDTLTLIWAAIIAISIFGYVVMDGFDLGIGILFPWLGKGNDRNTAFNTIAPVWDGNETWLVLGGGGLFAAFPLAYAVIMPAVYTPLIAMLVGLVAISLATPFLYHDYFGRWFEPPGLFLAAPVPLLVGVTALMFARALRQRAELAPFLLALALFLLSFIGLGISMVPWAIPGQISIYDAATAANSQAFMLVGVAIMLPIIIGYTAHAYWVFRGKVGDEGYH